MKARALSIIAAVFCAGLFATVAPAIAPNVAVGPAEDSGLVVPNIVTLDRFAAMLAPAVTTVRRNVARAQENGNWDRKVAHGQGWPYCDPACQRGGQEADSAHVAGVPVADRSIVTTSTISVNRTSKSDRLSQQSSVIQYRKLSPAIETAPASPKLVPMGCDAAFSSAADPARAHIYKRCMA